MTTSISQWLNTATSQLQNISDSARLDAEILLSYILQRPRSYVYSHPQQLLTEQQLAQLEKLLQRRKQHEPVAYIIGKKEFWSLQLEVTPDVLIPRPETELLVELALKKLDHNQALEIMDLGTGSGAIALALASECPSWHITATDISVAALKVARQNAAQLKINNIALILSDWFKAAPEKRFHAVISNPPYIPQNDPHLQQPELAHEPMMALASGEEGLDALKTIITQSKGHLLAGGLLMLEHGYDQAIKVQKLLKEAGYQEIEQCQDLAGQPRVSIARWVQSE